MRTNLTYCCVVAIASLGLAAYAANAQQRASARLVYVDAPDNTQCGGPEALHSSVAVRLGYDPFEDSAPQSVYVALTATQAQLSAKVEYRTSDGKVLGSRVLTSRSRDCVELLESVSLAVALVLDPLNQSQVVGSAALTVDSSPAVSSAPPAVARPLPPSPPADQQPATPSRATAVGASLAGGLSAGASPSPTLGLAAQIAMKRNH